MMQKDLQHLQKLQKSSLGVKFGSLCGTRMQSKAEALGGVILILLGLKILLEHLGIF